MFSEIVCLGFRLDVVSFEIFFFFGGAGMKLYRAKDYKDMSRKAANIISAQVIMKPNCVLGLATGSTPIGT